MVVEEQAAKALLVKSLDDRPQLLRAVQHVVGVNPEHPVGGHLVVDGLSCLCKAGDALAVVGEGELGQPGQVYGLAILLGYLAGFAVPALLHGNPYHHLVKLYWL